jgi:hypothetical protein
VQGGADPAGGPAQLVGRVRGAGRAPAARVALALGEGAQEGGRLLAQIAGQHVPGRAVAAGGYRRLGTQVRCLGKRSVTVSLGHAGASGRR